MTVFFDAVNSAVQKLQSKVIRAVTQVEERPHNVFLVGEVHISSKQLFVNILKRLKLSW